MEPPAESLTSRTTRAAQWRFAGSIVGAGLHLAIGVILARLLTPADFGIVALAYVVRGFTRVLGDHGMGPAVVQRAVLTERHIRTAFTVSVLLAVAIATLLVAAAPRVAAAMREPALTDVLRLLSISIVLQGTQVVSGGLMRRHLDFKRQAFIETVSYVVGYGGVALSMALGGYGVWSLVWGGIVTTLLMSAGQMAAVRHSVRPLLGGPELRALLHFGIGSTLGAFLNYIATTGDNLVVGRLMGAASVGLYSRAYNVMSLPHQHTASILSTVLFPAFAHVQGDPDRLRRGYLVVTQLMAMVAAPVMVGMAVAAPHLVSTLYGPQWEGVVLPLQILCIAGYFRAFTPLGGAVAQSVGRVYSVLCLQAGYAALVIGGVWVGSRYGLTGAAVAVDVAVVYISIGLGHLALSIVGAPWRVYLRVQVLAYVTAAITFVIALAIRLLLEASEAPSAVITIAIVGGCAVPWSLGILWKLGEPGFEQLRAKLPGHCLRLVEELQRFRRAPVARVA